MTFNFFMVLILIPLELAQTVNQSFFEQSGTFSDGLQFTMNFYLNAIQGIIIYTLFYQVCILGPIDMAKVWMLQSNVKVIGIFYCILCGFTNFVQSLVLE